MCSHHKGTSARQRIIDGGDDKKAVAYESDGGAFPVTQAFLLVRVFEVVKPITMTREIYVQKIVPVGFLFAVSLWMSNTAYIYLSVAFIQMIKALMPCVVYLVGIAFGVETFSPQTLANMLLITVGVVIASYGELNFDMFGFLLQLVRGRSREGEPRREGFG